eukprot:SAG31_NODE_957_length_10768_cov_3.322992_3_plen_99_part_00
MGTPECDDPMQSWCPSLAECIVEHIQSCPPGSSDSELSMVAASDGESKSGSMLITTAVAIVTIIAANELLKHIVRSCLCNRGLRLRIDLHIMIGMTAG